MTKAVRQPPPLLRALEPRAMYESWSWPLWSSELARMPRGDGHPVLVLPGKTLDDHSTTPFRALLRAQGYRVHRWHLGRNIPTPELLVALRRRLSELHTEAEEKVSLIGMSLGGMQARELAREQPGAVRQVITLGSPFRFRDDGESDADQFTGRVRPAEGARDDDREEDRPPLTVPATAIYTRTDGVVVWHQAIESAGPLRENIEVRGSHNGLLFNPAAVFAIADRLAQPDGQWAPFRPGRMTRHLYPRSTTWRSA